MPNQPIQSPQPGMQQQARYQRLIKLADLLIGQQAMMATAESCTGGGIATALTALPGSSIWFDAGFVTYSNQAKNRMLGVPNRLIAEQGAVSEAVVKTMVSGAIVNSQAHYAVAVSGIAGPSGGTQAKPVGTVWIAWGDAQQVVAECFVFSGDRAAVREQTIDTAIERLLSWLSARVI